MTTIRRIAIRVFLIALIANLPGCSGPSAVPGKVTITSTKVFGGMKADKAKEPGHKPPP